MTSFKNLPNEITEYIFSFLHKSLAVSRVCILWNLLSIDKNIHPESFDTLNLVLWGEISVEKFPYNDVFILALQRGQFDITDYLQQKIVIDDTVLDEAIRQDNLDIFEYAFNILGKRPIETKFRYITQDKIQKWIKDRMFLFARDILQESMYRLECKNTIDCECLLCCNGYSIKVAV